MIINGRLNKKLRNCISKKKREMMSFYVFKKL